MRLGEGYTLYHKHKENYTQMENDIFAVKPPAAKFEKIGDKVSGTITELDSQQVTDIDSGELKLRANGDPALQGVVTLDDALRLFCRPQVKFAINAAIREAGADTLKVGGSLTVTYSEDQPPTKKGYDPTKLFEAIYLPPAPNSEEGASV